MFFSCIDLPIQKLIHDDKWAYKNEGHGGNPVCDWPIYKFFKLYHKGEMENAEHSFAAWYIDQYNKYACVEKPKGGMKGGSLDRLYKTLQQGNNEKPSFDEALNKRVSQRFQLLESIRASGYIPNHSDPVMAYSAKYGQYMLFGGHHRVAVLAALGYDVVPDVFVFKNKLSFFLYLGFRKIKNIIRF